MFSQGLLWFPSDAKWTHSQFHNALMNLPSDLGSLRLEPNREGFLFGFARRFFSVPLLLPISRQLHQMLIRRKAGSMKFWDVFFAPDGYTDFVAYLLPVSFSHFLSPPAFEKKSLMAMTAQKKRPKKEKAESFSFLKKIDLWICGNGVVHGNPLAFLLSFFLFCPLYKFWFSPPPSWGPSCFPRLQEITAYLRLHQHVSSIIKKLGNPRL